MLPTAADYELRMFEDGSVLSSSEVSAGLNLTFLISSALFSPSEIKSGNISIEVANCLLRNHFKHQFFFSQTQALESTRAPTLFHSLDIYNGTSPVCIAENHRRRAEGDRDQPAQDGEDPQCAGHGGRRAGG